MQSLNQERIAEGYGADVMHDLVKRIALEGAGRLECAACHPSLPLVAGLAIDRPAVSVWSYEAGGGARLLATVGDDERRYDDYPLWERFGLTPSLSWHPDHPRLAIAGHHALLEWSPDALHAIHRGTDGARYVAYSPDGDALWASPAFGGIASLSQSDDGPADWDHSVVIDLESDERRLAPPWDTGVAVHPGSDVVATLQSDQGATSILFARTMRDDRPARFAFLNRALILDADGYEPPVFSRNGQYLAVRGNAYENTLQVFEFPSLDLVLATTLGEGYPGHPVSDEWAEQYQSWSRHNIAFSPAMGALLVGTPDGAVLEIDLANLEARRREIVPGERITTMTATQAGQLLACTEQGDLLLLGRPSAVTNDPTPQARVETFLKTALAVDGDRDLNSQLVLTDGSRAWTNEQLAATTTPEADDPMWLRFRAHINALCLDRGPTT
jgi:hypothetical protein